MSSRLLFRYVLRMHLVITVGVILGIAFIVGIITFAEASRMQGQSADWSALDTALRVARELPTSLQAMLPYVVLISTAILVFRMGRQFELAVLSQVGRPARHILMPLTVGGVLVGLFYTLALNPIAANSIAGASRQPAQIAQEDSPQLATPREVVMRDDTGFHFLLIGRVAPDLSLLEDITYLWLDEDHRLLTRVNASAGIWTDGRLRMVDAVEFDIGDGPRVVENGEMVLEFPRTVLTHRARSRFALTVYEMPGAIRATRLVGASAFQLESHFHNLVALPALLGAIAFLAGALVYHPIIRSGTRNDILAVLAAAFAIYFLVTFSEALGANGSLPAVLLAWSLPALFAAAGVVVLSVRAKNR